MTDPPTNQPTNWPTDQPTTMLITNKALHYNDDDDEHEIILYTYILLKILPCIIMESGVPWIATSADATADPAMFKAVQV